MSFNEIPGANAGERLGFAGMSRGVLTETSAWRAQFDRWAHSSI